MPTEIEFAGMNKMQLLAWAAQMRARLQARRAREEEQFDDRAIDEELGAFFDALTHSLAEQETMRLERFTRGNYDEV